MDINGHFYKGSYLSFNWTLIIVSMDIQKLFNLNLN